MANKEITLKEASCLTGYHPDYISYLIRQKKVEGQKVGRNWLVNIEGLKRHLDSKKNSASGILFKKTTLMIIAVTLSVLILIAYFLLFPITSTIPQTIADEDVPIVAE